MGEALTKAGKTVKVVKLPSEDHWLSNSETRLQMLREFDEFLRAHLK